MTRTYILTTVIIAGAVLSTQAFAAGQSLLGEMEAEIINVVEKASPAVVSIEAEAVSAALNDHFKDKEMPGWVKNFLKSDFVTRRRRSRGTGFIIDPGGYILTTEHVVDSAKRITVTYGGGKKASGRVLGIDRMLNLALIKIDGEDLPFIPLKKADPVRIGSWAITLGRPFGLMTSPSWGIVSGLSRCGLGIAPYEDMIQMTAPVNPGDSGGPVLNCRGEVIGIIAGSFAGYREMEFDWDFIRRFHQSFPDIHSGFPGDFFQPSQAQGVSFAIPVELARKAVELIRAEGGHSRGWMGIHIGEPVSADSGIPVTGVMPESPADRAGLHRGDLIMAVDKAPIGSVRQLQKTIIFCPLNRTVTVTVKRDDKLLDLPLTVTRPPGG